MRAVIVFATICLFQVSSAFARDKDLRTMTDATGETEIGFCSRPSPNSFGFPGHTFLTFSAMKPDGSRDFRSVGHTIADGASIPATIFSYFGGAAVAGKQMEELYTSVMQECLTVKVNRADFDRALTAAQPTLTSLGISSNVAASIERYSLGSSDCITFAEKVARALKPAGLEVPLRKATDTPSTWIGALVAANL